jgi:hypothetical protein
LEYFAGVIFRRTLSLQIRQNESNKLDMFEKLTTDVFSPEDAMPVIDDLSKHKREDSIKNLIKF